MTLLLLLLLSRFSRVQLCEPHRWQPTRLTLPWDSPGNKGNLKDTLTIFKKGFSVFK